MVGQAWWDRHPETSSPSPSDRRRSVTSTAGQIISQDGGHATMCWPRTCSSHRHGVPARTGGSPTSINQTSALCQPAGSRPRTRHREAWISRSAMQRQSPVTRISPIGDISRVQRIEALFKAATHRVRLERLLQAVRDDIRNFSIPKRATKIGTPQCAVFRLLQVEHILH